jgi:calcium-dependent protein kinase
MQATVVAAAKHLGKEEITGLRELFKTFDANGDGVISFSELSQALMAQGGVFTDEELGVLLRETDVDGSGSIEYEEFLAATINMALLEREEVLHKLFVELDVVRALCVYRQSRVASASGALKTDRWTPAIPCRTVAER